MNGSNLMNVSSLRNSVITQNFSVISGNVEKEANPSIKGKKIDPERQLEDREVKKYTMRTPKGSSKKYRPLDSSVSKIDTDLENDYVSDHAAPITPSNGLQISPNNPKPPEMPKIQI